MSQLIHHIYREFVQKTGVKPREKAESFFQENAARFHNISSIESRKALEEYLELCVWYLTPLWDKARYHDLLKQLDKMQGLLDQYPLKSPDHYLHNRLYHHLIFLKGKALYWVQEYREATKIFKLLVEHDSRSEVFKKWHMYAKAHQYRWIATVIYCSCIGLYVLDFIFGDFITDHNFRLTLLGIGLSVLLGSQLYGLYLERSLKKHKH